METWLRTKLRRRSIINDDDIRADTGRRVRRCGPGLVCVHCRCFHTSFFASPAPACRSMRRGRSMVAILERSPCRLIQRTLPLLCKEPGV